MKKVFVCTGNAGKLREFKDALGKEVEVVGIADLAFISGVGFVEPAEDAETFLMNGFTKLSYAIEFVGRVALALGLKPEQVVQEVLVDDSGLCVEVLGGAPGVHSATFGGLPRSDSLNRERLIDSLNDIGLKSSIACFVCFLLKTALNGEIDSQFGFDSNQDPVVLSQGTASQIEKEIFENIKSNSFSRFFVHEKLLFKVSVGICRGEVKTVQQNLLDGEGHGYDAMFYAPEFGGLSFASVSLAQKSQVSHRARAILSFNGELAAT